MATIELSKKELDKLLGKTLNIEFLKSRVEMLGMPIENVDRDKITIDVSPNRPDLLSQYGVVRALKNFIKIKKSQNYSIKNSGLRVIVDSNLKNIRPYTACCIVKNLNFDEEKIRDIIQFQEKLHLTLCRNRRKAAIGIYPLEKIKFPIYFKALDPLDIKFTPLGYGSELNGHEIIDETDQGKQYGYLLQDFKLYPVFIDSNKNILSMPPILNSDLVGKINTKTRDVFIEVSGYDFNFLNKVLNIIITTMAEMKGQICNLDVIYGSKKYKLPNLETKKMKIDINYINKLLGLKLRELDVKTNLEKMGFSYNKGTVLIPPYRIDILHQFDLMEEIAIGYGYENFKPIIESFYSIAEENKFEVFKEKISNLIIGLGFLEVNMPHLTNKTNLNEKMSFDGKFIALKNALSQEYNILRSWLIPGLIEVISNNKHNECPQKIFEIGIIFGKEEKTRLAVLITHSKTNFTEIKQILDSLIGALNLKYEINETEHNSFISGRVGRVSIEGKDVAYIGEINPEVLEKCNLDLPVSAFELNLTDLFDMLK